MLKGAAKCLSATAQGQDELIICRAPTTKGLLGNSLGRAWITRLDPLAIDITRASGEILAISRMSDYPHIWEGGVKQAAS
jgi:hypothetical protein